MKEIPTNYTQYKLTKSKEILILKNETFEEAITKLSLDDPKIKNQISLF